LDTLLELVNAPEIPFHANAQWTGMLQEMLANPNIQGQKRTVLEALQTRFETAGVGGTWPDEEISK
jgi:hypothetical protein